MVDRPTGDMLLNNKENDELEFQKVFLETEKEMKLLDQQLNRAYLDKDTDKVYVNEINTIPGSLSFYLWEPLGLGYKDMLDRCIDLAFKRAREAAQVTYAFDTNVLAGVKLGGCKGAKGSKL